MRMRAAAPFLACMALLGACTASPTPTANSTATPAGTSTVLPAPPTATTAPIAGPTNPQPTTTTTPTERPSTSEPVLELASGGTVFPGTYHTKFDPGLTLTIDHVVDLDCAPGYKCRGDIDVNQENWVGFEFGNVHGSQFDITRLDKVFDPASPSKVIDPPADLAAWLGAFPGLNVLSAPTPTIVGGVSGTQLDAQTAKDLGVGPTWGFAGGHRNRVLLLRVDNHVILINEQIGPDNTVGDFDAVVQGLEPLLQSIVWQ